MASHGAKKMSYLFRSTVSSTDSYFALLGSKSAATGEWDTILPDKWSSISTNVAAVPLPDITHLLPQQWALDTELTLATK